MGGLSSAATGRTSMHGEAVQEWVAPSDGDQMAGGEGGEGLESIYVIIIDRS